MVDAIKPERTVFRSLNSEFTSHIVLTTHHHPNNDNNNTKKGGLVQVCLPPVNREVTGSSGGLYTLHGVWERPPANNLPQTPHSAGVYGTGYVLLIIIIQ